MESGNRFIQMFAILMGMILVVISFKNNDFFLLIGGLTIVVRDTILVLKKEKCTITNKTNYDFGIRSGNKLVQLLASMYGLIMVFNYEGLLKLIGLVMFFGDGYLYVFGKNILCVINK